MELKDKSARVLTTQDCNRSCGYCVNNAVGILDEATHITDIRQVAGYKDICITGGEPMLHVSELLEILRSIRVHKLAQNIYLYTSYFEHGSDINAVLYYIDGLTYTMHADSSLIDYFRLRMLEAVIPTWKSRSFRLRVHPAAKRKGFYSSHAPWERWDDSPFTAPWECVLPANEDLFVLEASNV